MVGTSMSEDRFIVGIGGGKFNVIAGHKLNAEPLTRAEADRLAHERERGDTFPGKKTIHPEGKSFSEKEATGIKPKPVAQSAPQKSADPRASDQPAAVDLRTTRAD